MTRPHGIVEVEGESAESYLARHEAFSRARYLEDHPDWRGSMTDEECTAYIADEYAKAAPLGTLEEIRAATPEGKLRAEVEQLKAELAEAHAVVNATRRMANETNAAIRTVVLDALGEPDDGKTPLIDQVRRLVARLEEVEKDPAELGQSNVDP